MIMGANIGTTVTAQLVALSTFDIASYFVVFTFIGIFGAMLSKKEKIKTIFMTLAGLGLVFMALSMMSNSIAVYKSGNSQTANPLVFDKRVDASVTADYRDGSKLDKLVKNKIDMISMCNN